MVSADSNAQNDPQPEGFGSALIDEAACRDAALGDLDWAAVTQRCLAGQSFRGIQRVGRFSRWASPRISASVMTWGIRANVIHVRPNRTRFVKHRFRFTHRSSVTDIYGLLQHAPDLKATLAAASLPKFVALGEHDLWPLRAHRSCAQSLGARMAVYRGGHSPSETSPCQMSRDLIALYGSL